MRTSGRRIRGLDAEQRRAQRREQLLDAALELFAREGYLNTSIEQICATAYVSTKSFYEAFEGREDCYLALMRRSTERIIQRVVAVFEQTTDLPEDEATTTLVAELAAAIVDDPRLAKVLFGEGGAISWASERQRRQNRRWAAAFIEQIWQRYGHSDGSRHGIAVGVVGGLFDIIADWLVDADVDDPAAIRTLTADLNRFYRTVQAGL